jgi:hypothetical protein
MDQKQQSEKRDRPRVRKPRTAVSLGSLVLVGVLAACLQLLPSSAENQTGGVAQSGEPQGHTAGSAQSEQATPAQYLTQTEAGRFIVGIFAILSTVSAFFYKLVRDVRSIYTAMVKKEKAEWERDNRLKQLEDGQKEICGRLGTFCDEAKEIQRSVEADIEAVRAELRKTEEKLMRQLRGEATDGNARSQIEKLAEQMTTLTARIAAVEATQKAKN